jgi:hypothetical protein
VALGEPSATLQRSPLRLLNSPDTMPMRYDDLLRPEARIVRRLAEAYLTQLQERLPNIPGGISPEYLRTRETIDILKRLIPRLKRRETT